MSKTVVGLFATMSKAEEVKKALIAEGYSANVIANGSGAGYTTDETDSSDGEGIGQKISNFFHGLTGGDEDVHSHYAEGVNTGGALVGVTCNDDQANNVAVLLKQHGAREIEGKSMGGVDTTKATYDASETTGQTAIPIVEEQIAVGKREVDRGGVRVYSHVVEQPVSADVTLRDEKILVERRPVNRVASAADFNMGQGSVIEMNATGEEAVVGKTARVVEEVLVGKESTSHTEVIHDSVRKTEVEVEQIPGSTTTTRNGY
jgi:uncharacterized protein (TIGR02271 family)